MREEEKENMRQKDEREEKKEKVLETERVRQKAK